MSNKTSNPNLLNEVVYHLPFEGSIDTKQYGDTADLFMELYYPKERIDKLPVVIIVTGFPDAGYESVTGIKLSKMPMICSWARLIAAHGMVAINYSAQNPAVDVLTLVDYLQAESEVLGLDSERIGLWSSSGNVPNALHVIDATQTVACAVLCYGFMQDLAAMSVVAKMARQFRFANPLAQKGSIPSMPPSLIVRAGKDSFEGVNESIDAFVAAGLVENYKIELHNYADGVHAFDLTDSSDTSINLIKRQLAFLQEQLL